MSVLAYDCEGKPIRAGDRCIAIEAPNRPECLGSVVTVIGPSTSRRGSVRVDFPPPPGAQYSIARGLGLRRLPDHPETVTWESMRDIWTPEGVEA